MNPVCGGVLVAVITVLGGIIGAWFQRRGQREVVVLESYNELVANLRTERDAIARRMSDQADRHRRELDEQRARFTEDLAGYLERLQRAADELAACEARCEECRRGMAELIATVSALRAVVVDEIARAAADRTLAAHVPDLDPADLEDADIPTIRRFLEHLAPPPEPTT
jgi:hypothetical protein